MKLLFIITGLSTGGAEMMLYKLLDRINREQFDPFVISLTYEGESQISQRISDLDIPIYLLNINSKQEILQAIWRLINLVRKIQPDIIQGWMYHANLAAQFASLLTFQSVPTVWNIRHSVYSLKYEKSTTATIIKLLAKMSSFPKNIIYVSHISAKQHEKLGYQDSKSVVIPNGFDTEVFTPSINARNGLRRELGLTENAIVIGLIARYHPMKDHDNFLSAATLLLKKFPDIHFVLVGTGVQKENSGIVSLLSDFKLTHDPHFHFLGERQDISKITAGFDIASLVSAWGEGFPNVVGEAMSCGVPCVVTDVGDSAWIVGETGKVVPPKDPEKLAQVWQEMIELGQEKRNQLGTLARQRIIENFSLDAIVEQYEELYFHYA
ncbi:MAG: glycosyltransferase [Crocosphaera sp.]|uniref:glycosyltransferase family 4 protein n=1 Tax=Crocosphaera sp. TaxID=2729996 RepID=UPI002585BC43|nr:glycosyltransferase [Crocosphaera sp.]MCH2244477.1 glycosyltransferase [Crocosphaera sp.]